MRRFVLLALAAWPGTAVAGPVVNLSSDPAKALVAAGPGEAVVVLGLDQTDRFRQTIVWQRFDRATGKLLMPGHGDKQVYGFRFSYQPLLGLGKGPGLVAYVGVVPAGDYVLLGHATADKLNSFCFGAPLFHVEAGGVRYVGSYRSIQEKHFANRKQHTALAWEGDIAKARDVLGTFPALRDRLTAAPILNGAKFDCSGDTMWAYSIPSATTLIP